MYLRTTANPLVAAVVAAADAERAAWDEACYLDSVEWSSEEQREAAYDRYEELRRDHRYAVAEEDAAYRAARRDEAQDRVDAYCRERDMIPFDAGRMRALLGL